MKPTSLSSEFYTNLFNKIESYGFDPETEDDCNCNMELEVNGFYVTLDATFEVKIIDDSFDHAFGTEHCYHIETDALTNIEAVTITDEDENDVSDLFDNDKFWEQFKQYTVKFYGGGEVKSGDTVQAGGHYVNRWDEMTFLYYDSLRERYICVPVGKKDNHINRRSYPKMRPCD